MPLDERYFVTSDLSPYFVDKNTGLPLANGSISFYRDVARTTPKTVYQLIGAPPNYFYVPLPNSVPLSAVGQPQNGSGDNVIIYYYPYDSEGNLDLYYIVVADSNGVMQETIEAWPNITGDNNPTQNDFSISNQISNAQFTETFLNKNAPTIYSVTAASNKVFAFAPNWDFIISGTGSVTIQRIAIAGNDKIITSPPYVLDVALSSGITKCHLRQRFNKNSGLWASTENQPVFLSGNLIAINQLAGETGIEMFYVESSGGSTIPIVQQNFDNSRYKFLIGVTENPIPLSTNTDLGDNGYIDIYISFLENSHVRISSIQIVPTLKSTLIPFELNSSKREQAFMGDYYIPKLNSRPQPSILTGWDFTVNPFQFGSTVTFGDLTIKYICDQTIARSGTSGTVVATIDGITNGLKLTTAGNNDAFYLMQYLSGNDAKNILGTPLSVNFFGYVSSNSDPVTMRVYLFRASSGASIPISPASIGSISASGIFTLTEAGWTEIPRSGLDTATAILPNVSTNDAINNETNDIPFTGWQLTDPAQIGNTDKFAIVVTFAYPDTSTVITINSISLIPSAIPARPAPESFDTVLRKCQYYYETSYDRGVSVGSVSPNGAVICEQYYLAGSTNPILLSSKCYSRYLTARYVTEKRIPITPSIYSPTGIFGNVLINCVYSGSLNINTEAPISGNWILSNNGNKAFAFSPVNSAVEVAVGPGTGGFVNVQDGEGVAKFHYVADARFGIV